MVKKGFKHFEDKRQYLTTLSKDTLVGIILVGSAKAKEFKEFVAYLKSLKK